MNCSGHFAARAGLEVGVNGGFLVNRCMLASDGVYLSGEVANVRMTVGRGVYTGVDHAYHTGVVAGRNMSGVFDVYDHIPIYEATAEESDILLTFVGHCSSAFETHGFWWKLGSSSSLSSTKPTSPSSSSKSDTSTSTSTSTSSSSSKIDPIRSSTTPRQQTLGQKIQKNQIVFFVLTFVVLVLYCF